MGLQVSERLYILEVTHVRPTLNCTTQPRNCCAKVGVGPTGVERLTVFLQWIWTFLTGQTRGRFERYVQPAEY
jgi:hypothetical protein